MGDEEEILVSCPEMPGVRYYLWACRLQKEKRNPICVGCAAPDEALKKNEGLNNVSSEQAFFGEVG
ncbi:MAG: hypothetical protein SV375_05205 [Thermodesulfobacteriota bacterium]|nr:hypothetical protein [Thermodesulfobacteriota bacterium]